VRRIHYEFFIYCIQKLLSIVISDIKLIYIHHDRFALCNTRTEVLRSCKTNHYITQMQQQANNTLPANESWLLGAPLTKYLALLTVLSYAAAESRNSHDRMAFGTCLSYLFAF
jgi:hypothetical protein